MDGNSLSQWMSTVFGRSEAASPQADDYFTPRLALADRQLRAFATRTGGTYQGGAVEWSALANGVSKGDPNAALWGRGSSVTRRLHGLEIEVTVGVQPLTSGQRGEGAVARWLVLAPGVTVAAGPRSAPMVFNRFDASWSADDELAVGAERLRHLLGRGAAPAVPATPLPSMPPSVTSARDRAIERASKLVCAESYVFMVGRPLPRAPEQPRQFGQGSFEVDALVELVERARAFAHALATA
jgi:hypothetical protein